MPIAHELQPLLDTLNAVEVDMSLLTPEAMRAGLDGLWTSWAGQPPLMEVTDQVIAGPGGDIAIRIYDPGSTGPSPAIVCLHGGGFVVGSLDSNDATSRHLAHRSGAVVVSVDYRLAPEHPWPAACDDALAALRWLDDNAAALGIDRARLVVAGDSAGGNLAAVIALRARDEEGPHIALQVLVYPCFDPRCSSASYRRNAEGYLLTADQMQWFWEHYLTDEAQIDDPHVDPRRADATRLPRAVVVTAEYDPLRDEGADYVAHLREAGVAVEHTDFDGMVHGFVSMFSITDRSLEAIDLIARSVRSL